MANQVKQFLSIFILFLLIVSCDPCDDCDTVSFEPTVSLVFINQDSVNLIDARLSFFSFNDSALAVHIDALDTLRSRLEEVQAGLDTGNTSLQEEKDQILILIPERQADSLLYASLNVNADSATILTQTKATINSGLLQVDQIEILGTLFVNTYEGIDSATTWTIPLSYDGEFNTYEVVIAGIARTIEFSYDNTQEVDAERNVLIRAENIQVVSSTFDSFDNCEENCVDGKASFTFYF